MNCKVHYIFKMPMVKLSICWLLLTAGMFFYNYRLVLNTLDLYASRGAQITRLRSAYMQNARLLADQAAIKSLAAWLSASHAASSKRDIFLKLRQDIVLLAQRAHLDYIGSGFSRVVANDDIIQFKLQGSPLATSKFLRLLINIIDLAKLDKVNISAMGCATCGPASEVLLQISLKALPFLWQRKAKLTITVS